MTAAALDLALPALTRLAAIASHGTSQARRVANFLLAWWDAETCGGFDPMELGQVDAAVARDIIAIMALIAQAKPTPTNLGFADAMTQLAAQWRPQRRSPQPATARAEAADK